MKIIVPLAGPEGEVEKEFKDFKNLIKVYNIPLIKYIADKRPYDLGRATFILRSKTDEKYNIAQRLRAVLGKRITIYRLDKITEGAACSVLQCLKEFPAKEDILIDLIDQHLELGADFMRFLRNNRKKVKGVIPVFKSKYWKWSYVRLDSRGFIIEVREKVDPPISSDATAGVYYFSRAQDYIAACSQMIKLDKRVKFNNKFFISCVYNELPVKSAIAFPARIICPLGSAEGIKLFPQIAW